MALENACERGATIGEQAAALSYRSMFFGSIDPDTRGAAAKNVMSAPCRKQNSKDVGEAGSGRRNRVQPIFLLAG